MNLHITLVRKRLATLDALVRLVVGVCTLVVAFEGATLTEGLATDYAHKGLLTGVCTRVDEQNTWMSKQLATLRTHEWRFGRPAPAICLALCQCSGG